MSDIEIAALIASRLVDLEETVDKHLSEQPAACTDGKDGKDGRDGLPPEHKWEGTRLAFRDPDGTWGKSVNLKGDSGAPGAALMVPSARPVRRSDRGPVLRMDLNGLRYWFLLYETSIKRVDNSVSPSIVEWADSTDWDNREGLTYACAAYR